MEVRLGRSQSYVERWMYPGLQPYCNVANAIGSRGKYSGSKDNGWWLEKAAVDEGYGNRVMAVIGTNTSLNSFHASGRVIC